jgi:hypothetical protein
LPTAAKIAGRWSFDENLFADLCARRKLNHCKGTAPEIAQVLLGCRGCQFGTGHG